MPSEDSPPRNPEADGSVRTSHRHKSEHKHRHRKHKHKDRQREDDPAEHTRTDHPPGQVATQNGSGRASGAEVGSGPEDGEIVVEASIEAELSAGAAPVEQQPLVSNRHSTGAHKESPLVAIDTDATAGARQDNAEALPVELLHISAEHRGATGEPPEIRQHRRREHHSHQADPDDSAVGLTGISNAVDGCQLENSAREASQRSAVERDRTRDRPPSSSSRHADGLAGRQSGRDREGRPTRSERDGPRPPRVHSRSRERSVRPEPLLRDSRDDSKAERNGRDPGRTAHESGRRERDIARGDRDGSGVRHDRPDRSSDGGRGRRAWDSRSTDAHCGPSRSTVDPRQDRHSRDDRQGYRRDERPRRDVGSDVPMRRDVGVDRRDRASHKRSRTPERDDRDRQRRKERARSPQPKVDEAALAKKLLVAVTSTADVEEEDEEQRLIEERRRRMAEVKAKHHQQQAVIDAVLTPTASALLLQPTAQQGTIPVNVADEVAQVAISQQQQQQQQQQQDADYDNPMSGVVSAQVDDGDRTPEGDRSTSDDEGNADGPVLDIWAVREAPDDESADPGAPSGRPATAPSREPGASTAGPERRAPVTAAVDDMFAEELPVDELGRDVVAGGDAAEAGGRRAAALADAYDDPEGYYKFQVGELMDNNRYEAISEGGRGVFSVVVRARDRQRTDESGQHPEVAIKLIRANETMHKAALVEQNILRRLAEKDPENRKHCIRLLRTFEYRNHSCLVFESMDLNMRELTKKYGRNVGLSLDAVGMYACQLLVALRHLKRHGILHADIKPDNILVNARRNKVKLCDFGSAMEVGDVEVTPYLVSRFYRAPEVILGLKYDTAMDMWSLGCVLYELCTGRILFPGATNNAMLKLMMDVKGPFPRKMLKKAIFIDKHFEDDPSMSFALIEEDAVLVVLKCGSRRPMDTPSARDVHRAPAPILRQIRKLISNPTVKSSFPTLLAAAAGQRGASGGSTTTSERLKLAHLADLLEKMMTLDPEKRVDPDSALRHAFVKEFLPKHGHHTSTGTAGVERSRGRKVA